MAVMFASPGTPIADNAVYNRAANIFSGKNPEYISQHNSLRIISGKNHLKKTMIYPHK
jgi:hypothetical protein